MRGECYLAGVGEPVHGDAGLAGVEGLAHPGVELVVADAAPEGGLAVHHRLGLQPGLVIFHCIYFFSNHFFHSPLMVSRVVTPGTRTDLPAPRLRR